MVAMRDSSATALAVGRLTGCEPLGFEAGDNNWYRFVANGPGLATDPSGLQISIPASAAHAATVGWTAQEIATTFGISAAAAAAMIYNAEITKAAESVVKLITANAAAKSTDPCEAARIAVGMARKGIENQEAQIARHEGKIADPIPNMTKWYPGLSKEANIAIATNDWKEEIAGYKKGIDAYKVALEALKKAEYCACWRWYKPWSW
jgi:uncharacterized protein RhaS with RHS repeats